MSELDELISKVSKGDKDAIACLRTFYSIAHIWDDLVDQDKTLSTDSIHHAFQLSLLYFPQNPFYQCNAGRLIPILTNSIVNWRIANKLETGDDHDDLLIAFIMRSSYADLMTTTALLVGGIEWAVEIGVEVRRFFHSETFTGYLSNLQAEKAARMSHAPTQ